MSWSNRVIGLTGLAVGVTAATATGLIVRAVRNNADDPYENEDFNRSFGKLRKLVTTDGVDLLLWDNNKKSDTTVVFLHGFATSHRCWFFQHQAMDALGVNQIYYDQRGHGISARGKKENDTIDQLAEDLRQVLDLVKTPHVVLVGHSMGGMTILKLAELYPHLFGTKVDGVALYSTSAGDVPGHGLPKLMLSKHNMLPNGIRQLETTAPWLVNSFREATGEITAAGVRQFAFGKGITPQSVVYEMVRMLNVTSVEVLTDFLPAFTFYDLYDAVPALRKVKTVLVGAGRDQILPVQHMERIAELIAEAEYAVIDDAGHMVIMEYPDQTNAKLVGLVQEVKKAR
jgi:pimeloyl-ACP methyl ester carboxylesterase